MQVLQRWKTLSMLVAAAGMAACGGDGKDGGDTTAGKTTYVGTITGFGSVHVNGVQFATTGATFEVDDAAGGETDLRLGMVVRVEGSVAANKRTGTATRITYDDEFKGPVQGVVLGTGTKTFTVLGIQVVVENNVTVFDDSTPGFTFDALAQGDVVEVSGFYDASGALQATYIEKEGIFDASAIGNPGNYEDVELTGNIAALQASGGAGSFTLRGVTVNFDTRTDVSEVAGGPKDGLYVEVSGDITQYPTPANPNAAIVIQASQIELENKDYGEGNQVSLQGLVANFTRDATTNQMTFTLNVQRVDASAATFEPPGLKDVLKDGMRVEVEGKIENGVLIAAEVEAHEGRIELNAPVGAVDAVQGTVSLKPISTDPTVVTVSVNSQSLVYDHDTKAIFALADLASGNYLEVRAYEMNINNQTRLIATRVERRGKLNEISVEGRVSGMDVTDNGDGTLTIALLGLTYRTAASTQFEGPGDARLNMSQFLQAVTDGKPHWIEVTDKTVSPQGGDGVAEKVEIDS